MNRHVRGKGQEKLEAENDASQCHQGTNALPSHKKANIKLSVIYKEYSFHKSKPVSNFLSLV